MKEFADALNKVTQVREHTENFFKLTVGDTGRLEEFIQMKQKSRTTGCCPPSPKTLQAVRDLINESQRLADSAANRTSGCAAMWTGSRASTREDHQQPEQDDETIIQPIIESTEILEYPGAA